MNDRGNCYCYEVSFYYRGDLCFEYIMAESQDDLRRQWDNSWKIPIDRIRLVDPKMIRDSRDY